jgi:hypothetical protein
MGVIDTADTRIVPAIFEDMGRFEGDLFPIKKRGKWGYSDTDIKLKIPYQFQMALPYVDSLARVKADNKWGMIDYSGEIIIPFDYNKIQQFETFYILENDTAIGLISMKGTEILPVVFNRIILDDQGFFIVLYKGKLAYFDFRRKVFFWKEKGFAFLNQI